MDNIINTYHEAAVKFTQRYQRNVNDHVIHLIASVMMARDGVCNGGHFVTAVLENDLLRAVTRADEETLKEIKLITLARDNAHVEDKYEDLWNILNNLNSPAK